MIEAVVFDMDGVIVDSEQRWEAVRRQLVVDSGREYPDEATRRMQGMSAPEWEAYLHEELGVPDSPDEIGRRVVAEIEASYRADLPLIPGVDEAVRALAVRYPLAVASSSNRKLIELALSLAGLDDQYRRGRLERGGGARQARARRLPRGGDPPRRRGRGLRRRRGARRTGSARRMPRG